MLEHCICSGFYFILISWTSTDLPVNEWHLNFAVFVLECRYAVSEIPVLISVITLCVERQWIRLTNVVCQKMANNWIRWLELAVKSIVVAKKTVMWILILPVTSGKGRFNSLLSRISETVVVNYSCVLIAFPKPVSWFIRREQTVLKYVCFWMMRSSCFRICALVFLLSLLPLCTSRQFLLSPIPNSHHLSCIPHSNRCFYLHLIVLISRWTNAAQIRTTEYISCKARHRAWHTITCWPHSKEQTSVSPIWGLERMNGLHSSTGNPNGSVNPMQHLLLIERQ